MADDAQTPAAEAAVTTSEAPSGEALVKAIMEFDPFGPSKPAKDGPDTTGTEPAEGEADVEGEKPVVTEPEKAPELNADGTPKKPVTTETPAPTQQGPTQREQELQAQVAALQAVISQGSQRPVEKKPGEAPAPKYNLGLPPQIIQGLRSEDEGEFAASMHAVVNGIANKVWNDMQEHLSKEVAPALQRSVGEAVQQQREIERVYSDFYGKHPHLNNPAIQPIVQQAALQVGRQWMGAGKAIQWNEEFANAVAAAVHAIIPPLQQQQQVTQQQPKPKSFVAGTGTRPNSAAAPNAEFAEVLSAR